MQNLNCGTGRAAGHRLGTPLWRKVPAKRPLRQLRRAVSAEQSHDDDDVIPLFSIPREENPEDVPRRRLVQAATIGERLAKIRDLREAAELNADKSMHEHLYSKSWQGDVYVGSRWNVLTVGLLITFCVPVAGLLFAWLTYGSLWTGSYHLA